MASDSEKKAKSEKGRKLTQEQIFDGFNALRQEQRSLTAKVVELEIDLNEHTLVAEALQKVDSDRRCYRMVGGVLVERTVKDVLPAVLTNKENISKAIESLNKKISAKGQEINEFREKYNIQLKGEPVYGSGVKHKEASSQQQQKLQSQPAPGVLVENKT